MWSQLLKNVIKMWYTTVLIAVEIVCVCVCIGVCMYPCVSVCPCACARLTACEYACVCMPVRSRVSVSVHACARVYAFTHACAGGCRSLPAEPPGAARGWLSQAKQSQHFKLQALLWLCLLSFSPFQLPCNQFLLLVSRDRREALAG